ncbi:MAG: DUF4331 domain-containing protein [Pseudomonadota bacterium]|nr:DUF4331 domain-containing protein [Pseudomonadota bacterium]
MKAMKPLKLALAVAAVTAMLGTTTLVTASSHREAPNITKFPKLDNTDVYAFRSYEAGRADAVTIITNFQPLQDPFGGPSYFLMDENGVYDLHIDNNGDGNPNITFEFRFFNQFQNKTIPVGGMPVPIALVQIAPVTDTDVRGLNVLQFYTVTVVNNETGARTEALNPFGRSRFYMKPFDNIGSKTFPNYARYADAHIGLLSYSGCGGSGKIFAGQRREGFSIALGEVFDLLNLNPVGPRDGERNDLDKLNVTSIAIEVPISCLARSGEPVIGVWSNGHTSTSGALDRPLGPSISRLGMPLVNEVIIGLQDKDKFNASRPADDAQFLRYVTNPTLPALIEVLFASAGVKAPTKFPRTDLVSVFLTGIQGLNQPANVKPSEMLRLNTSIAPRAAAAQNNLGVLAGDNAGYPNGRRPGDDVVDITLRVAMGALLTDAEAPSRNLPFTDGAATSALRFFGRFPYLATPIGGDEDI